jgi:predicted MFS family arabinose efflux permease
MIKTIYAKLKEYDRDFILFLLVGVCLGLAQSVDGSTFNNFLKDKFHMLILQRSALELPRELPGFLVFIIIGFLYALGDVRIAAVANVLAAIGMFALGIIPPEYSLALLCIFVYSSGQHVYMPLSNSIAMNFAKDGRLGRKLGQVSAANTAALVFGSAVLFILFKFVKVSYTTTFTAGAIAFLAAAALLMFMKPNRPPQTGKRFVFRKNYMVYYIMCVLNGARKQITITFGPWVLVDVFKQKVTTMTLLFFVISVVSIFFKPLVGNLIDRVGEKFIMGSEAIVLFLVCFGYIFADVVLPVNGAILMICICYALDQLSSAAAMGRSTYLKKIAVKQEDVSPTLSLGISIDHIMSMSLPFVGGVIWYGAGNGGYKYVFLGGAVIAILNFITTRFMKIGKSPEPVLE